MNRSVLVGSANRDKARELAGLLSGLPWRVLCLEDVPPCPAPDETEESFEGNAILKARYYAHHAVMACVADDSGLVVDALGGAPGVYSARFAGPGCTDQDNNGKLLAALVGVPDVERTARFVCCAAFAEPTGRVATFNGICEGRIAEAPRGANGFGYDPLFIPLGLDKTFGELEPREKHTISHRGRALALLRHYLERQF